VSRLLTVSVGRAAPLAFSARGAPETVASGIVKSPVSTIARPQPVAVGALGLDGDEQVDLTVHGGRDKAVYVYPAEHYAFWETVCAQAKVAAPAGHGALGENLTIEGLLETGAWVGDQLEIGEVALRVESPRGPCYKLNAHLGFDWASKMMIQSGYTGFYCSVVRQGKLAAGDAVLVRAGDRVVSIEQVHRLKHRPRRP